MKTMFRRLSAPLVSALVLGISGNGLAVPPGPEDSFATIPFLDAPRYMGRWYEIAKYPNRFQKICNGETTADYRLHSDGSIEVTNRCRMSNGELNEAIGTARQVGGTSSPKLKVRFAPWWLSFIPAVWGDYWIVELDAGYQLAVVSEPRREYLWVLSRTPQISPDAYAGVLERLRNRGFDTSKLEKTRQEAGR